MKLIPDKVRSLLQFQRGILLQYGWLRSWWVGRPVSADGSPLPWITYPAMDFLSQFDFSADSVFEWGSGFSTLWWAKRCKCITTVESHAPWVPYIIKMLPPSVKFVNVPRELDAEIRAFVESDVAEYDVISIDNNGPYRAACADIAVSKLGEGGLVLLDNSDQCPRACQILRSHGLVQIDFSGYAPGAGYAQCTSIFFKGTIKFRGISGLQPRRSVAQPNPPWEGC